MRGRFQKLLMANSLQGISKDSELTRRRGRWVSSKIIEIYVQKAWAVQFLPRLPEVVKSKILQGAALFRGPSN